MLFIDLYINFCGFENLHVSREIVHISRENIRTSRENSHFSRTTSFPFQFASNLIKYISAYDLYLLYGSQKNIVYLNKYIQIFVYRKESQTIIDI